MTTMTARNGVDVDRLVATIEDERRRSSSMATSRPCCSARTTA
ncbi:hypothetical protein [Agromyces bauzanensis]|nr:hypothetical protein [Agromyces bauzanensis]